MSIMTVTAIILLIIGPLPWYALLIIVGRELRWHVQDKERAGARLLWLLFAGYTIEGSALSIVPFLQRTIGYLCYCCG